MRGSLKLFTWFGIPVHLHWTFGLIFLYAIWIGYANNFDIGGVIWLMGFFLALFACVLLHEYGHSLTARRYGVQTQDIILTPIGGIARLERMPEKPVQEFLVALAGPLVNVAIAIVVLAVSRLVFQEERWELFKWVVQNALPFSEGENSSEVMEESGMFQAGLLFYLPMLLVANIMLVVFNLIPAFPMDGGRILRALLAMRIGRLRATRLAAMIGQVLAVGFILIGFTTDAHTLAVIGFFVIITARTEYSMVQLDEMLRGLKASDLVRPNFTRLQANDWMQTAVQLLRQGLERHFLVFDNSDKLLGLLAEEDILRAMRDRDLSSEVGRYLQSKVELVHLSENLQYVYYLIRQKDKPIIGVTDNDRLVGVIDEAGLDNFLRLQRR